MLSPAHFSFFQTFLKTHSGYHLESGKEYVIESRLPAILKSVGIDTADTLVAAMKSAPHGAAGDAFLQAMTINETMFFRDKNPFDHIEKRILPALTATGPARDIQIWCTACSSGQEPYSVAMLIDRVRDQYPGWGFHILATDLSGEMIERGRTGTYSEFETSRGLPPELRDQYFTPANGQWTVKDSIRKMITFERMNLMQCRPGIGPFDLILCRNVLIYFDTAQKTAVLNALRKASQHPGYLLSGAAEVLNDLCEGYKPHPEWSGVYETADK